MRAWLPCGDRTYFARHADADATSQHEPHSAVTRLIQGIYETHPQQWRTLLRRRIYADYAATPMCRAMVKVAAKRLTDEAAATEDETWQEVAPAAPPALRSASDLATALGHELPAGEPDHPDFMRAALALAAGVPREGARHAVARPIAAVLVGANGEPIAAAVHAGAVNRTLHAEVCLLQGLWARERRGIPPGARLFTTLEPCRMCAAMIVRAAEAPETVKVYFAAADPGPMARQTALENGPCAVALLEPR